MKLELINKIVEKLNSIHNKTSAIKDKISETEITNKNINNNKLLLSNTFNNKLFFQINVLKTQFIYYNSLNKLLLESLSLEVNDIIKKSETILLVLNKLEFNTDEKKKIFEKIKTSKCVDNITFLTLHENISILLNNFPIINDCIVLFTKYIEELKTSNKSNNIHTNTYELDVHYKKEKLLLEYNRCVQKLNNAIDYFDKVIERILNDIENSKILKLYL